MIKDKFTPLEIQEVEDLAKVMGKERIASHFNITAYVFDNLRKSQPELEEAYKRGVNTRKSGMNFQKRKQYKLIKSVGGNAKIAMLKYLDKK